jgi:hypothetical protein
MYLNFISCVCVCVCVKFFPIPRYLYFSLCYFPPTSSKFSLRRDSYGDPYQDLYVDIVQYFALGEVILLREFNTRTKNRLIPLHDRIEDVFYLQEIDQGSVCIGCWVMLVDPSQPMVGIFCTLVNHMTCRY